MLGRGCDRWWCRCGWRRRSVWRGGGTVALTGCAGWVVLGLRALDGG